MVVEALGIRHWQTGTLESTNEDIGIIQMGHIAQIFTLGDFRAVFIERARTAGILGVTMDFCGQFRRLIAAFCFFLGIIHHMHA